jgi:hypothetical protein
MLSVRSLVGSRAGPASRVAVRCALASRAVRSERLWREVFSRLIASIARSIAPCAPLHSPLLICGTSAVMLRSACLAALCITASGFTGTAPGAFTAPARAAVSSRAGACSLSMVAAGKPPGAKLNVKAGDFDINAPTKRVGEEPEKKEVIPAPKIETECDADYGPLLKALQNGEWELADQLTRDMLIWIGGPAMRKRNFVYFAEAKKLPLKDMRTIDNLWTTYSKGKFGYSVQRQIWNSKKVRPCISVI